MYDDPVRISDPLGDEGDGCCQALWDAVVETGKQVVAVAAGAANAWSSDQALGVGNVNSISSTGASYGTQVAYIVGQKIGHAGAIVTGAVEAVSGVGGEIASVGLATPIAVPVALHGASSIAMGVINLIKGSPAPTNNSPSNSSASKPQQTTQNLPKPPKGKGSTPPSERDPKRVYTKEEKAEMLQKQDGNCANCGSPKKVDEVHGHHIKRHADGGTTTSDNGAAVCHDCHTKLHQ